MLFGGGAVLNAVAFIVRLQTARARRDLLYSSQQ